MRVYNVPHFDAPASQKNFFKGDKVQLKWNDHGTSLIVLAQTEVDKTNKNYYGETTLYLLSANGGFDSRIQLGMSAFFRRGLGQLIRSQTRTDLYTMFHGHQSLKASPWSMDICQRKPSSSMPRLKSRTPFLSQCGILCYTLRTGGLF